MESMAGFNYRFSADAVRDWEEGCFPPSISELPVVSALSDFLDGLFAAALFLCTVVFKYRGQRTGEQMAG